MERSCLNFDKPIQDAISRIRFASRSNNLLISSWDSNLRLYDVDKSELRLEAPSGGAALLDCCFGSESMAISANSDGSITRYDMHLGESKAIGIHDDLATCVEYSVETSQIVTGAWDKKIKFWDARSAGSVGCLDNLSEKVESLSLSGFSLVAAIKSSLNMYDLRYLDKSVQAKELFKGILIKCVRASPDLEGFVAGSNDGRVALEFFGESNTKNKGYAFKCHPKSKSGRSHMVAVNDIAFNPYKRGELVTGDNEGNAVMWDVLKQNRLAELHRFPNSVTSLTYNHDGQLLAAASSYTYQEANEREDLPQIFVTSL
ncbi:mitotic checkpoint protein BUB3.3 [Andrographis paniculata]|uniref:mitotic checkpoint protein BUB3.3 n=1 Tax=Andrographis paniculata TaxID=175694 RepID=UPI0021E8BCD9|nr:mitotic checkpoint protein BUB3.3 [Andrographis paniculata]